MTSGQVNTSRALLATCVAAAARASEIIREGAANRSAIVWEEKSAFDFVSDVDRRAEQALTRIIADRHPKARVLGEEFSPAMTDVAGLVFVADPLDGTTNFLHGFPCYAVSIAAMVDGTLEAGAVLNVANGELFTATAGGGARLNGQPIAVSTIAEPARAIVGTGFPFKGDEHVDEYLQMLARVMRATSGIRRPGAAALDLANVAAGRFDAFWEITLAPWDIAAGLLLIREAGGVVTTLAGDPVPVSHTSLVAGNPSMHEWLLDAVGSRSS
ncbi:MAG: inositol monophosphatase family protein [Gemmatimonadaceae bacterium]